MRRALLRFLKPLGDHFAHRAVGDKLAIATLRWRLLREHCWGGGTGGDPRLDILAHNPASWSGSADTSQVNAVFTGNSARNRGRPQLAIGTVIYRSAIPAWPARGYRYLGLGDAARWLIGRWEWIWLRFDRRRCRGFGWHQVTFAVGIDEGDGFTNCDINIFFDKVTNGATGRRFHLHSGFVSLDVEQRFSLLNRLAFLDTPSEDTSMRHIHVDLRHDHFRGH